MVAPSPQKRASLAKYQRRSRKFTEKYLGESRTNRRRSPTRRILFLDQLAVYSSHASLIARSPTEAISRDIGE